MNFSASAYIKDKRLCILGVHETKSGPIPFSHAQACDAPDGPVNITQENIPEVIRKALDESQQTIMSNIKRDELRLAVEGLVDRARHGDQNAVALIIEARKNAEKGNPRAKMSVAMMMRYAKSNSNTSISGEGELAPKMLSAPSALTTEIQKADPEHYLAAVKGMVPSLSCIQASVALSNGPKLDKAQIEKLIATLADEDKKLFSLGYKTWANTRIKSSNLGDAGKIGKCIGLARTIQMVRSGKPIALLSKRAGWELD